MSEQLFPMDEATALAHEAALKLSYGQRLTIRARNAIAAGKHPANGLPIDTDHTCGTCAHLRRYRGHAKVYLKCPFHRLGTSSSEASDMRASWPACPKWEQAE